MYRFLVWFLVLWVVLYASVAFFVRCYELLVFDHVTPCSSNATRANSLTWYLEELLIVFEFGYFNYCVKCLCCLQRPWSKWTGQWRVTGSCLGKTRPNRSEHLLKWSLLSYSQCLWTSHLGWCSTTSSTVRENKKGFQSKAINL